MPSGPASRYDDKARRLSAIFEFRAVSPAAVIYTGTERVRAACNFSTRPKRGAKETLTPRTRSKVIEKFESTCCYGVRDLSTRWRICGR